MSPQFVSRVNNKVYFLYDNIHKVNKTDVVGGKVFVVLHICWL